MVARPPAAFARWPAASVKALRPFLGSQGPLPSRLRRGGTRRGRGSGRRSTHAAALPTTRGARPTGRRRAGAVARRCAAHDPAGAAPPERDTRRPGRAAPSGIGADIIRPPGRAATSQGSPDGRRGGGSAGASIVVDGKFLGVNSRRVWRRETPPRPREGEARTVGFGQGFRPTGRHSASHARSGGSERRCRWPSGWSRARALGPAAHGARRIAARADSLPAQRGSSMPVFDRPRPPDPARDVRDRADRDRRDAVT